MACRGKNRCASTSGEICVYVWVTQKEARRQYRTEPGRKGKERKAKAKARDASAVVDAGSATSKESVEDEGKEEREPRRSYADEGASGSEGARELERGASADSARV